MTAVAPINSTISHVDGFRDGTRTVEIHDGTPTFGEVMEGVVANANSTAQFASGMAKTFAAGARDDIHGTMIALSKADVEMKFLGSVRTKVTDAFYELWRMQI
jgi:flagellar hook-basal body complex protein FliE